MTQWLLISQVANWDKLRALLIACGQHLARAEVGKEDCGLREYFKPAVLQLQSMSLRL